MILFITLSIFAIVILIAFVGTIRLRVLRRSLTYAIHDWSEGDTQRLKNFLKQGNHPGRYTDLLHFLEDRECFEIAAEIVETIPPSNQKPRHLVMALSRMFLATNKPKEAQKQLESIPINDQDSSLLEMLCKLYIALEDRAKFLSTYKLYLGTNPKGSKKWVFEAYELMFQKRFDQAKPLLEKALAREQNILNNSISPLMKQEMGKQVGFTQKAITYWKRKTEPQTEKEVDSKEKT